MDVIKRMKKLCLCCMEEHEVQLVHVKEHTQFKGVAVDYTAEYEYCDRAEEYTAEDEMISRNDMALKDAYRRQNHLLTSEEIANIRSQYGMSQTDLSSILGWGGKTITRYEGHQVQDAAHDFILRKLDDDPECFLEVLNGGRERISLAAYQKYYAAIVAMYEAKQDAYLRKSILAQYMKYEKCEELCGGVRLNLDKVIAVIRYFVNASEVYHLYKVKLMKLLWYADALSYKRHGHAITGLVYTALPMGAVPIAHRLIVDLEGVDYEEEEFSNGSGYHFVKTCGENVTDLTAEEQAVLDKVICVCGMDTKDQIVRRMHGENAFKETPQGEVISFRYATDISID